jgi:hypothetical protein
VPFLNGVAGSRGRGVRGRRPRGGRRRREGGGCIAVSSAGWLVAAPGRWTRVAVLLHEQGRAAGRGRHGAGATDRQGWAATGA